MRLTLTTVLCVNKINEINIFQHIVNVDVMRIIDVTPHKNVKEIPLLQQFSANAIYNNWSTTAACQRIIFNGLHLCVHHAL